MNNADILNQLRDELASVDSRKETYELVNKAISLARAERDKEILSPICQILYRNEEGKDSDGVTVMKIMHYIHEQTKQAFNPKEKQDG